MTDFRFDPQANDITVSPIGDFEVTNVCSRQNSALIFNKKPASIIAPQYGIGFEALYPNLPQYAWGNIEADGERQIIADGALYCQIVIGTAGDGVTTTATIDAQYIE